MQQCSDSKQIHPEFLRWFGERNFAEIAAQEGLQLPVKTCSVCEARASGTQSCWKRMQNQDATQMRRIAIVHITDTK